MPYNTLGQKSNPSSTLTSKSDGNTQAELKKINTVSIDPYNSGAGIPSPITPNYYGVKSSSDYSEYTASVYLPKSLTPKTSQGDQSFVYDTRQSSKKNLNKSSLNDLSSKDLFEKKQAVRVDPFYQNMVEFVPNVLYFDCPSVPYRDIPSDAVIFTTDNEFQYIRFYLDFGPPNIAQIVRFHASLKEKIRRAQLEKKVIVAVASSSPDKCTNSVFLLCCFILLEYGLKPAQAVAPIKNNQKSAHLPLMPYRDAGYGNATYWIDIEDCVCALYEGVYVAKLLDLNTFDVEQYEFYERVENGDFGWVIPNYFVALASPNDNPPAHILKFHEEVKSGRIIPTKIPSKKFQPMNHVTDLAAYLRSKLNVKAVIRLNNKLYDRQTFLKNGVEHYELYFPDGSVPPIDPIVRKFMAICDKHLPKYPNVAQDNQGPLGVHCKAGLGRTGTLICCWMMRTFKWTARQCISWCRIMRPGSVVGPQQNWLESMESTMIQWGRHEQIDDGLMEIDVNEGSSTMADRTMGMHVPLQPRKDASEREQPLPYNLRSHEDPQQSRERKQKN